MIRRIAKMTALGGIFILLAMASAYLTVSFFIKGEHRVVVPGLEGKDVVRTLETLSPLGLNTKLKGSEFSDQIPAGHVLSQDPAPGSEIKKGRDIRIVLSKGPRTLLSPDLKRLPFRQAQIIVEQNGLCMGSIAKTFHSRLAEDVILEQFPDGGIHLEQGICIDLLVSMGPKPESLKMPDLKGRQISEAATLLRQMNLTLGPIEDGREMNLGEDVLMGQDPPSGYAVARGTIVKLTRNRKGDVTRTRNGISTDGAELFRYRVKDGFLKTHIRMEFHGYGLSEEIMNAYMDPGEEVLFLIPKGMEGTLLLYEDDALVVSKTIKP